MKLQNTSNKLSIFDKERRFTNKCRNENYDIKFKLDLFKIESKRIGLSTSYKPTLKLLNKINKEINSIEIVFNRNDYMISKNDKTFSREIKNLR